MTEFDALKAALARQADARAAYYAEGKVERWFALYQRIVSANAGVVIAAREYVEAVDSRDIQAQIPLSFPDRKAS